MTQTERDAQIDSLLADNTQGDISAKDTRDIAKQASSDIQVNTDNVEAAIHRIDDLNLDPSGTTLMSLKNIELQKPIVLPSDEDQALVDNRLCTVATLAVVNKNINSDIDDLTEQLEDGLNVVPTFDDVERLIHEYRTTINYDTATVTPTRAECIAAFKQLPHFDWTKDDDFYIRQVDRTKMALVKYRALASSVDEATAGEFWIEKLTLTK